MAQDGVASLMSSHHSVGINVDKYIKDAFIMIYCRRMFLAMTNLYARIRTTGFYGQLNVGKQ